MCNSYKTVAHGSSAMSLQGLGNLTISVPSSTSTRIIRFINWAPSCELMFRFALSHNLRFLVGHFGSFLRRKPQCCFSSQSFSTRQMIINFVTLLYLCNSTQKLTSISLLLQSPPDSSTELSCTRPHFQI